VRAANKREQAALVDERGRRANAAKRARRLAEKQAEAMPVVEAAGPRKERIVDAELVSPSPRGGLLEVFQNRYLLRLIVQRQLATMYAASALGLAWSYIQPAMRFGVYYLVMGLILNLHKGAPFFAMHLFTGMVVVHYFGETWNGGTRSIWQNKNLIQKMRMPREIFPVASALVAAYHTMPQLILLVVICLVAGWHLSLTAIAAGLLGVAILISFAMAMALFFSALNAFYKDFQNIVATVLQFMHFLVPMMYTFSRVYSEHASHPVLYQIYMANPVAQAVLLMQRMFWYPLITDKSTIAGRAFPPDLFERGLITLVVCVAFLWLGQRFFARAEASFPERL
jgi:ABC-2 type transport system permease protein